MALFHKQQIFHQKKPPKCDSTGTDHVLYNTYYTIRDPNNIHLMTDSIVVGSCNGLICILKEKTFFLWNPSIRSSIELPKIELQTTKYGFGWDEETDAYKVFAVVSEKEQKIGKVYSTKTNSWKTVKHGCLTYHSYGVFVCGKIHWLTETGYDIECFDLKSEVFEMIKKPCEPSRSMWVNVRDGGLSLLCEYNESRLDSWVMKKHGVKESWVLQNTAPIPQKFKSSYTYEFNDQDKGIRFFLYKTTGSSTLKTPKYVRDYIESLVLPVCTSRQDEIEQEQVAEGRPKSERPAPARQNKRKAPGRGVEVTQESEEIVHEQACSSVVEGRPKRQNKKVAVRSGVEGTKENLEMEQEQVAISIAEGRPKRLNRRRPARYDT